jgi:hypothetical protein
MTDLFPFGAGEVVGSIRTGSATISTKSRKTGAGLDYCISGWVWRRACSTSAGGVL